MNRQTNRQTSRTNVWVVPLGAILGASFSARAAEAPQGGQSGIDLFEKKIRPVLIDRCYKCHSVQAGKHKGDLFVDTRAGLRKGGLGGPAIVPGDPDRSLVIKAIRRSDDLEMPPDEKLKPEEVSAFEEWVRRGAPDPRTSENPRGLEVTKAPVHWAFQPPRDQTVPGVKGPAAVRTPIDAFIAAALEARGMAVSKPADRRTLLRRVTFDLTGLPPTPEAVEAFVKDETPQAFAKVVDGLLASPHYAERWGRHWLDVARYSDTKGALPTKSYELRYLHSHVYRDWVIRAFAEDLPFDEFVVQQLAADQLVQDGGDRSDLAALGFLTVGPRLMNNLHDIIDDRIDAVTRGFLGLTVSCARCHDHKFDPIPTRDYYSLYGVFAGSYEKIVPLSDARPRTPGEQAFAKELAQKEKALETLTSQKKDALLDRLRRQVAQYLTAAIDVSKLPTEENQKFIEGDDLNPVVARSWRAHIDQQKRSFHPVFAPWHAFEAMPEQDLRAKGPRWLAAHRGRINRRVAQAFSRAPPSRFKEVVDRYGSIFFETYVRWQAMPPGSRGLPDAADEALRAVLYGPDSPIAVPVGSVADVEFYFDKDARLALNNAQKGVELAILNAKEAPPHSIVLLERPAQKPARVFRRGNPGNKGDEVPRQFLEALAGPARKPFQIGSGRLELARAIASRDNPLTARVWVNRVWYHHFGNGLVRTPSDFGARGEPPTHPELLDWLARRFVADGWSTKKLHKLIVLSAAYQQSSDDVAAFRALDPENRLLWRFPRRRLDAESMRDAMLAVAGRLDATPFGRPVWLDNVPSVPRRTIYGFSARQSLTEVLRLFDGASGEAHTAQRPHTTVPQQALFSLNSPFVAEQARALARRTEVTSSDDPAARVKALYRLVYGRAPSEEEIDLGASAIRAGLRGTVAPEPTDWFYGEGRYDPRRERVFAFRAFPLFAQDAYRAQRGGARLDATGGRVGSDLSRATIRRWRAPVDGEVRITDPITHKSQGNRPGGKGVRARVVWSRGGELGAWGLNGSEALVSLQHIHVKKGDTIDFLVEGRGSRHVDDGEFAWNPRIEPQSDDEVPDDMAELNRRRKWLASKDFAPPPPPRLSPVELYAQTLLLTNEFLFVD